MEQSRPFAGVSPTSPAHVDAGRILAQAPNDLATAIGYDPVSPVSIYPSIDAVYLNLYCIPISISISRISIHQAIYQAIKQHQAEPIN